MVFGILIVLLTCKDVSAKDLTCHRCKKPIHGKYYSSKGLLFHEHCFTCGLCDKPINGDFTLNDYAPYHPDCYLKTKNLVCAYCGKVLDRKWVEHEGERYHPSCYKNHVELHCDICGLPINGKYIEHDGIYHDACYKKNKLPACVVCLKPIEGRHLVDAWGSKAHTNHGGIDVKLCESCGRIISKQNSHGGMTYADGRIICGICLETAVTDQKRSSEEQITVTGIFSSVGIAGIPKNIPLNLVDLNGLKQQSDGMYNASSRGFTRSNRYTQPNGQLRTDHTIYILSGLPMIEFTAILAHEMLHVWLFSQKIVLSDRETEGFCNLGAMLVLQRSGTPFSRILLKKLETNPDPVYGNGFRIMRKKVNRLGWDGLLEELSQGR